MQTRLFRPPVTDDYVRRAGLEEVLEEGRKYPIVLVAAPAGYGKSTQISHWVGRTDTPYVWISLEEMHNDLSVFLRHLEAGLTDWSSATAKLLKTIAGASDLPPADQIAYAVSNDMEDAANELILVLDDYHNIRDASVHLFVESLLTNLPATLRVAIVTRRTPPIALSRLRSRNLVLDIRLQDLQFDDHAMHDLVEIRTGEKIDAAALGKLKQVTEGWPAGLQMLLLALAGTEDVATYLQRFEGNVWQIQEYLVEEVLRKLPPNVAKHIGTTAILNRFSAELCQALIDSSDDSDVSGTQLVELIRSRGLFCIPLDDSGEWFRYHHLFHELLLRQTQSLLDEAEIRELHGRAAAWFDGRGQLIDAIGHYLRSDNSDLAAQAILSHKDQLIRKKQWRRLDRALNLLPTKLIESNVEMLILLSWTYGRMGRLTQEIEAAHRAQKLFDSDALADGGDDIVSGQLLALWSTIHFHEGDARSSLDSADTALKVLAPEQTFARGEATMMRGVAMQMLGDGVQGRTALLEALAQSGSEVEQIRGRLLIGLCYLSRHDGQLHDLQHYGTTLLNFGRKVGDDQAIVHASWFLGVLHYQQNNLKAAEEVVRPVIKQKWWPHQRSYSNSVLIMCAIHTARGELLKALALLESLIQHDLDTRATYHLSEIHAMQSELTLAQGDQVTASNWANGFEIGPLTAAWGLSVPALTKARILLQTDPVNAREEVRTILDERQAFYESTHNAWFLIETLTLQALLYAKSGDEPAACRFLSRAVTMAESGGFIRVFVDQGPELIPLLNRLKLSERELKYVGTILAGFQASGATGQPADGSANKQHDVAGLLEPLSKRENEVLSLLAERLTNKEIGEQLFISPDTVKRHAHNIFAKLNVNTRREARAKAIGLGIVSSQ